MKPLELAKKYMDAFSSGEIEGLSRILSPDLQFTGPLASYSSAREYMDALRTDPPENLDYEIMRGYEDMDSACLIYRFHKPGISTLMAQYFEIRDSRISRIFLVFDPRGFKTHGND